MNQIQPKTYSVTWLRNHKAFLLPLTSRCVCLKHRDEAIVGSGLEGGLVNAGPSLRKGTTQRRAAQEGQRPCFHVHLQCTQASRPLTARHTAMPRAPTASSRVRRGCCPRGCREPPSRKRGPTSSRKASASPSALGRRNNSSRTKRLPGVFPNADQHKREQTPHSQRASRAA